MQESRETPSGWQGNRDRRVTVGAALLLGMHAVLAWLMRPASIAAGNDDAVYLLLARALRQGHYRELFYLDAPVHSQYPPGYPALLALVGLPSQAFDWLVAVNIALSVAALGVLFLTLRTRSPGLALLALAVLAVNPALLDVASRLTSEPLYLLLTVLGLHALRGADVRNGRAGAFAIAAALTRSIGVTFVGAALLELVLRRRWKPVMVFGAASLVTVGVWIGWTVTAPQQYVGRSYIADATLLVREHRPPVDSSAGAPRRQDAALAYAKTMAFRIRYNVSSYLTRRIPTELSVPTVAGTPVDNMIWLLVIVAAGGAGLLVLFREWRAATLYLGAYAALLILWPFNLGRFLAPVLPFIVVALLAGAWRLGTLVSARLGAAAAAALAAILIVSGGAESAQAAARGVGCDRANPRGSAECFDAATRAWLGSLDQVPRLLPDTARLMTAKEGPFYFYTGRKVVPIYGLFALDSASIVAALEQGTATHLLLTHLKGDERTIERPIEGACRRFTFEGAWSETTLLLRLSPPGAGERDACDAIRRWRATW